jgi:uncharacterized membrane protein YkvA (DUF1232 family)
MKSLFVAFTAIISVIYMLNPTLGVIEVIPDNIPVIGNLDEATAMAVLVACLRYFGVDIAGFFGKEKKSDIRTVKGKVVDAE